MRNHAVDNLRNATILLLFPVHTMMIWNDFGSRFYIWQGESRLLSTCIVLVNPWFMPLLFVLAGISARYALEKRTAKEFAAERNRKLLIPLLGGLLLHVPVQTLYARKFFDRYAGGFFENWTYFFTHLTDFTGYDGAFTPGHLWFIEFLLMISVGSLLIFRFLPYKRAAGRFDAWPVCALLGLFVPVWLAYYLGNFGGFSIGKNWALYLLGYYVLSQEAVQERLARRAGPLAAAWLADELLLGLLYDRFSYYGDLWINFIGWLSILALLALGLRLWNRRTRFTAYWNRASYPVYILHQTILVVLAYYVVQAVDGMWAQAACICAGSFLLTVLAYHLLRRLPFLRAVAGIRD